MFNISGSELLLYGGIAIMAAAAIAAAAAGVLFMIKGKKLRQKLEQEYGKPL